MLINKNKVTAQDREQLDKAIEETVKTRNCTRPQAVWFLFKQQEQGEG